ncbi:MAG: hypothetical protein E7Y34_02565, partial [Mycoplasma sp.]|nr:hypothetical protein [Mycoplasma sp.]
MMNVIDEQRRKSFLARYSFEGDDKFTKPKQRMFFRMLYDYGQVCIYNPTKKTISTLKKKVSERKWEVLSTSGLDNFVNNDTIKSIINDDRVVMLPNNFYYDENLRPMVGYAITYPGSNSVIKSVKVSVDDAAFALANPDLHPMWYLFMPFNYQYGTIQTIIKKRLQMSDPLIVKNNVNNNGDYLLVERIFDLDNNILPLNPSTASLNSLQQVDSAKIDINKLITPDLKKLSFGYDDKITDLIVALNEIYNH